MDHVKAFRSPVLDSNVVAQKSLNWNISDKKFCKIDIILNPKNFLIRVCKIWIDCWSNDSNSISTRLGLLHAKWSENYVHCTFFY